MGEIFFIKADKRNIENKDYYKITVLDLKNCQLFSFYRLVDNKSTSFVSSVKIFQEVSGQLTFVIKRNNRISFDIK